MKRNRRTNLDIATPTLIAILIGACTTTSWTVYCQWVIGGLFIGYCIHEWREASHWKNQTH